MTLPYYQSGSVTIYHGDCAEILPTLPTCALVLTDPPYGLRAWNTSGGQSLREDEAEHVEKWDQLPSADLMRLVVNAGKVAIVWGGNYLCGLLGLFPGALVWNKMRRGMHFADGEIAWTNLPGTTRIFDKEIVGNWRAEGETALSGREPRLHPTQKPIELMQWCIQRSRIKTGVVLDPFMGSGSTLVAARNLGFESIGIEKEERYCEAAAARLSQELLLV